MADSNDDQQSTPHGEGSSSNHDSTKQYSEPLTLPIAVIGRIMKKALPAHAKISMEAKETIQRCTSEFISFITGEAALICNKEGRKTLDACHVLRALSATGFDNHAQILEVYLQKFTEYSAKKEKEKPHDVSPVTVEFDVGTSSNGQGQVEIGKELDQPRAPSDPPLDLELSLKMPDQPPFKKRKNTPDQPPSAQNDSDSEATMG